MTICQKLPHGGATEKGEKDPEAADSDKNTPLLDAENAKEAEEETMDVEKELEPEDKEQPADVTADSQVADETQPEDQAADATETTPLAPEQEVTSPSDQEAPGKDEGAATIAVTQDNPELQDGNKPA